MAFETPEDFASPTGATLALRHRPATGDERGILLVQHGLGEHAGRYDAFAKAMAGRGFHVYAHDHRGHGLTSAPDAPQGRFADKAGALAVIADSLAVREHAAKRHPGLPVVVFGHSMGGLVALNFAETHPDKLDALAVWNSNLDGGAPARAGFAVLAVERMLLGSDMPSRVLPRLTFEAWGKRIPGRKTGQDWLSHDEAQVRAVIDDPLCNFELSISLWRDVFALILRGGAPARIARLPKSLPVHLTGGGQDPATGNGRSVRRLAERMSAAGLSDVTLVIHPEMRHETLKERGAKQAVADFAAWVDRALAGR